MRKLISANRHIRAKTLFWLLLISTVAITGATGLAYWHMSGVQINDELKHLASLRDIIRDHIDKDIAHHTHIANSLAQDPLMAGALSG